MELLSKAEIFGAQDIPFEDVPIPEWGGKALRVATMSGKMREAYERLLRQQKDAGASDQVVRACLVAAAAVDGDGKPLFDFADIPELAKRNWLALDRACNAAIRVNKLQAAQTEADAKN